MTLLLALPVFLAAVAIDFLEAYYVRAIADGSPRRAGLYSVAMYGVGCVGFFAVLDVSYYLLIPECAGLYVGSVLAVRRQTRITPGSMPGVPVDPGPSRATISRCPAYIESIVEPSAPLAATPPVVSSSTGTPVA